MQSTRHQSVFIILWTFVSNRIDHIIDNTIERYKSQEKNYRFLIFEIHFSIKDKHTNKYIIISNL